MKEWWINLALREKQSLVLGSLVLLIVLLYEILWMPFSHINDSLREQISQDQTLVSWMEKTDQQIQSLKQLTQKNTSITTSAGLLSLLQNEIHHSPFANNLAQFSQAENNSVQIRFQKINFDSLMQWLIQLWHKHGVSVLRITVTPNGALGIVDVNAQFYIASGT